MLISKSDGICDGPRGVARMAELSRWLGGAELRVGHTYLPGDRWSNIEGAPGFLDVWADWRNEKNDRMFVLNVPMLERNEDHVSDAEVRLLLRRGAAGQFDAHFRRLAERLVELNVPDTVIVLGRYRGACKATGSAIDAQMAHVWRVADGKLAAFQQYVDTLQVARATGAA